MTILAAGIENDDLWIGIQVTMVTGRSLPRSLFGGFGGGLPGFRAHVPRMLKHWH
jgi:hypothetical protein